MVGDGDNRIVAASCAREGLTGEEHADFLKAIERVRQRSHAYLKGCRDAEEAIRFIGDLHRAVDAVYRQGTSSALRPDCKAGCSRCCRLRVEIVDAVAFLIAEEVQRRPPVELAALTERLRRRAAVRNSQSLNRPTSADCAFLVDSLCSIYAVRPAACRKAHSLSAEQCHAAAERLPQNFQVVVGAEALMAGVSAAYREAGLPSASRELCAAVLIALNDDTAKSRWYAGTSVFSRSSPTP